MVEEWCHDSVGECGVCASVPFGLRCWDMLLVLVLHVKDACGSVVCLCVLRWWVVGQWWVSGRGGAKCGGGWVSCWAETCVSSVMRQGWVQWVGVQCAAE